MKFHLFLNFINGHPHPLVLMYLGTLDIIWMNDKTNYVTCIRSPTVTHSSPSIKTEKTDLIGSLNTSVGQLQLGVGVNSGVDAFFHGSWSGVGVDAFYQLRFNSC